MNERLHLAPNRPTAVRLLANAPIFGKDNGEDKYRWYVEVDGLRGDLDFPKAAYTEALNLQASKLDVLKILVATKGNGEEKWVVSMESKDSENKLMAEDVLNRLAFVEDVLEKLGFISKDEKGKYVFLEGRLVKGEDAVSEQKPAVAPSSLEVSKEPEDEDVPDGEGDGTGFNFDDLSDEPPPVIAGKATTPPKETEAAPKPPKPKKPLIERLKDAIEYNNLKAYEVGIIIRAVVGEKKKLYDLTEEEREKLFDVFVEVQKGQTTWERVKQRI